MALPEQTRYSIDETIPSAVKAAFKVGKDLPKRAPKTVDVSKFQGVADNVSSAPTNGTLTTPFGGSTKFEKFHPGVDIANKIGTAINAFTPGTVEQVVSGKRQGDPAFGNFVSIRDPQGNLHRYSHLQQTWVKAGQPVVAGAQIGTEGNTGQTYSTSGGTGSHLDYRVRDVYGKYINPSGFLK